MPLRRRNTQDPVDTFKGVKQARGIVNIVIVFLPAFQAELNLARVQSLLFEGRGPAESEPAIPVKDNREQSGWAIVLLSAATRTKAVLLLLLGSFTLDEFAP